MGALKALVAPGVWEVVGGGGGGTEEVFIGPSDPGAGYDLWYDTDAATTAAETYEAAYWNSAWGTIATGALNPMSGTVVNSATAVNLSAPLTVTLLAGRKYEFEACIHATGGGTGATGFNMRLTGLPVANDTWNAVTAGAYGQGRILVPIVGTGASFTVTVQGSVISASTPALMYTQAASSFFVCRDVGPALGSVVPVPFPPNWMVYDDRYPLGIVGYSQTMANQGSIGNVAVDLTGCSVTFPATVGRRYKATARAEMNSSVAGDVFDLLLATGANVVLQTTPVLLSVGGLVASAPLSYVSDGTTSGSTTWKLRALRTVGSGVITNIANAARPTFILVEDIGIL